MAEYKYIKEGASLTKIRELIIAEGTLYSDYEYMRYDLPDDLTIGFSQSLTASQKTILDDIISNYSHDHLLANKEIKNREVDRRTQELISEGFLYDGKRFSLSQEAQLNWLGLQSYSPPVEVTTIDDKAYSVADINLFVQAAASTKQSHLDSGRILKQQVLTATTQQELDAIVDNR